MFGNRPATQEERDALETLDHAPANGCLLLHLSPHGMEVMNGRYGMVQNSPELMAEGIQALRMGFDVIGFEPHRIHALSDRNSQIFVHGAGQSLGLDVKLWPQGGSDEPGLIVAYDLAGIEREDLPTLRSCRPGLFFWCHAPDRDDWIRLSKQIAGIFPGESAASSSTERTRCMLRADSPVRSARIC